MKPVRSQGHGIIVSQSAGTVSVPPGWVMSMSGNTFASPRPHFLKRLGIAGVNLLTPLHAGLIVGYFALRWLGGEELWFVDAIGYILPLLFAPLILLLPGAVLRRSRVLLGFVAAPAALFLLTYGHLYLPRWPVNVGEPAFSVMTYNVLHLNSEVDLVAAEIAARAPDVVGLRELEPPMARALEARLAGQYPHHRFEPGCGFFSRHPILEYEAFRLAAGEGAWAQQFVLDVGGRPVNFLSVHPRSPPLLGFHPFGLPLGIPTGFANEGRDADITDILSRLEEMDDPLVVIGDFNLTDQQSLYAPLTRHLRDAHRESGWGMGFTYTHFPRFRLPLWRIDYVFHSPNLVAVATSVGDYGGSDHRPVVARLAFGRQSSDTPAD